MNEFRDHAESEAGAFAFLFGSEEWLEDFFDQVRRYAGASINHGNAHPIPCCGARFKRRPALWNRAVSRGNSQLPAVWHSVAGIDCEVEDRRLQCSTVDEACMHVIGYIYR